MKKKIELNVRKYTNIMIEIVLSQKDYHKHHHTKVLMQNAQTRGTMRKMARR